MYEIAIVEDMTADRKVLRSGLECFAKEKGIHLSITEFVSGEKFLQEFSREDQFQLVFLDIEMPGINGMETAEQIRKIDREVMLVFVTNMVQFAVRGYSVSACDFIVKPVERELFQRKLEATLGRILRKKSSILIKSAGSMQKVRIRDIRYVEVYGRKIYLHTGNAKIEFYGTLKKMAEELEGNHFVKCNKCYLVNLAYVEAVVDDTAFVEGEPLAISRREKKEFLREFSMYEGDF